MKLINKFFKNTNHGFEVKVTTCNSRSVTTETKDGEQTKFARGKFEWMIEKGVFIEIECFSVETPELDAAIEEKAAEEVIAEIEETIKQGGLDADATHAEIYAEASAYIEEMGNISSKMRYAILDIVCNHFAKKNEINTDNISSSNDEIKITDVQLYIYKKPVQTTDDGDFEYHVSYSANIALNNEFMIQCAGDTEECAYSFPASDEAFWSTSEKQDAACSKYELSDLVEQIESAGFENNLEWLKENAEII